MSFTPTAHVPIGYSVEGAGRAVGLSVYPIKEAITRGDLTVHWAGSKRLVKHADLVAWFDALPYDKPVAS